MKTKLITKIYRTIQAKNNCIKTNNLEWAEKHENILDLNEESAKVIINKLKKEFNIK